MSPSIAAIEMGLKSIKNKQTKKTSCFRTHLTAFEIISPCFFYQIAQHTFAHICSTFFYALLCFMLAVLSNRWLLRMNHLLSYDMFLTPYDND